ncbi:hypothetical protein [uncultured Eudoraea sp.]|uniref:hypothetical protein n=1 Tax=uncultured Eudoraea sp. TaxID=1035614 RepID=UPI002614491D|nr:hypothetical protein [uncultured Eudoraea sp.]
MKTKSSLLILAIGLLALIYFLQNQNEDKKLDYSQKASFYSIKCTVAKYLLEDVDTTQQISPLFENLGNLTFPISTSKEMAQTFFNQGLKLTYAFNHAEAMTRYHQTSARRNIMRHYQKRKNWPLMQVQKNRH